jgi:hypothetical protein
MPETNPVNLQPDEVEFLQAHLSSARHYLEFGAGTSTVMAANTPSLESIDSVESSKPFIEDMLGRPEIGKAVAAGRLHIHAIDIGPTGEWGTPVDRASRHLWPDYSSRIFEIDSDWDLILIDGRFRVACCLNALLHTGPACRILIHDFRWRKEYFVVLEFFDVVERLNSFVSLRRKTEIDTKKVGRVLRKYQYLPFDITAFQRARDFVGRKLRGGW